MIRHFYITDSIEQLEEVELELESNGFTEPQIHVLSDNDTEIEAHHLHPVESVLKQDVVHSTEVGSIIGLSGAALSLVIAYTMGWTNSEIGWVPFIFLAIIILGFCTWEGGFIGIQKPNINFKRFQEVLKKGKYVLFVDVKAEQERTIEQVMKNHPHLEVAGVGESTPHWLVWSQNAFNSFKKFMP
jgi:hypothetical protein